VSARLFGTDGIRGVALQPPLDERTVTRLGTALAAHLGERGLPARILLAGDTRASTPVLAQWLGGACAAAGAEVHWAGVLPTPAVSHLLRDDGGFGAGVVISASHNPAADNGIKLMTGAGSKWSVAEESALEARLDRTMMAVGKALPPPEQHWQERTIKLLLGTLPDQPLAGMHVVVDAANGAASPLAQRFFAGLGARVRLIHAAPDGANINLRCGALHPEELAREVRRDRADFGVALDGDADRAILVTDSGRVLNGDDTLLLWGRDLARRDMLPQRIVVATVMSNFGLEEAFHAASIRLVRCAFGDREVWDAMEREGAALGGEQSGHVICSHFSVTGDGLLTAGHVFAIAAWHEARLETLADLRRFPQILLNLHVADQRPLAELPGVNGAIRGAEARLAGHGRVFVRYSGTEPLLRVMVEAASEELAQTLARDVIAAAREEIGA
jgi:phosphoglucosamine mutase